MSMWGKSVFNNIFALDNPWFWVLLFALLIILLLGAYFWIVTISFAVLFRRPITRRIIYLKPLFGEKFHEHETAIKKTVEFYEQLPHEVVNIVSGGVKLTGRFYENKTSDKIVIFVHGYYSYGMHDIGFVETLHQDLGVSLLIIDQRACGNSEGTYMTLGILERYDVREWLFYLNSRFNGTKDLYLHGFSMGAATSLLVTGLQGLPPAFKGVIADCGYSRTKGVLLFAGNRLLKIRPKLLMWGINILAHYVGGFNLRKLKISNELKKNTKVPILFIHGTSDQFVPYNMSIKNYKASSVTKKKLVAFNDAQHCESYFTNPELYLTEVRDFINGQ